MNKEKYEDGKMDKQNYRDMSRQVRRLADTRKKYGQADGDMGRKADWLEHSKIGSDMDRWTWKVGDVDRQMNRWTKTWIYGQKHVQYIDRKVDRRIERNVGENGRKGREKMDGSTERKEGRWEDSEVRWMRSGRKMDGRTERKVHGKTYIKVGGRTKSATYN